MNSRSPAHHQSVPSQANSRSERRASIASYYRVLRLLIGLNRIARRCALEPRILQLAPRPIDLLTRSLTDVAAAAEAFARAVAKERLDFESHYRDNRKHAIASAWEIAHVLCAEDDRIAYEFACACLRAHRNTAAHDVLKHLVTGGKNPQYVAAAKRRFSSVAWKAGDTEEAINVLRSVRGRPARTQYRQLIGVSTIRNGLLLAESGETKGARRILVGGLLASGIAEPLAERIARVYLNAAGATDSAKSDRPRDVASGTVGSPTPIILSGFGWSGSGAVGDFLTGHSSVADVFAGREVGLWTGKYGLDRLYTHFASKGFNRRLLLEFLTCHCFGHRFLAPGKGTKSHGGMWALASDAQRPALLDALDEWIDDIQRWRRNPSAPLLPAFQALSSRFLHLLAPSSATCVILSNCIPCDSIVGIRMFEEPVVIVSWRDPGDAYASKIAAFPGNSLTFDGWKDQLMSRITKYLAGKAEVARFARLWMDIAFEDFVRSADLRQNLLSSLNLRAEELKSTFDPEVSARNIGILKAAAGSGRSAWADLSRAVESARQEAQAISGRFLRERP